MSLKENLSIWNEAVLLFDSGKYDEAIEKFREVPEQSAKIVFNSGCLLLLKHSYHGALRCFSEAVKKDPYLSVAYFQRGCTNVHLKCYTDARRDFQFSLEKMRGGEIIDYRQLGLSLKLYASQVLMNLSLVNHHIGDRDEAVHCVQRASRMVKDPKHEAVIVEALGSLPDINVKLMEIPIQDSLFRPPKSSVANLKKKDFLGKATVVSSVAKNDNFVGFEGARKCSSSPNSPSPTKKQNQLTVDNAKVNRGSLTPPPPGRPPPILPQQASRLQSMPKRPPPQLNGSRSTDIQMSRSNNQTSFESRSSDISRRVVSQPTTIIQPVSKRPPPQLNGSNDIPISSEILKQRSNNPKFSESMATKVSKTSETSRGPEMSRPPPPNYPPPILKKTKEGSEVKVKPPRPPLPVLQKKL